MGLSSSKSSVSTHIIRSLHIARVIENVSKKNVELDTEKNKNVIDSFKNCKPISANYYISHIYDQHYNYKVQSKYDSHNSASYTIGEYIDCNNLSIEEEMCLTDLQFKLYQKICGLVEKSIYDEICETSMQNVEQNKAVEVHASAPPDYIKSL